MSAAEQPDWRAEMDAVKRRLDALGDRRTTATERVNILSDRLAGVEHRQWDVYRMSDRIESRLDTVEEILGVLRDDVAILSGRINVLIDYIADGGGNASGADGGESDG